MVDLKRMLSSASHPVRLKKHSCLESYDEPQDGGYDRDNFVSYLGVIHGHGSGY